MKITVPIVHGSYINSFKSSPTHFLSIVTIFKSNLDKLPTRKFRKKIALEILKEVN